MDRKLADTIGIIFSSTVVHLGVCMDSDEVLNVLGRGFIATCTMRGENPQEELEKIHTMLKVEKGEEKVN